MKETELQELERALQAATPAPWQTFPVEYVEGKPTGAVDLVGAADRVVIAPNLDKDDAALSAALRNAAPSLVGEVRSARKWKAALDALVDRLDFVHASDPYKCVWTLAHIRFGPYKGPNYIAELEAARALLGNADASPPPDSSAALREARRLLGAYREEHNNLVAMDSRARIWLGNGNAADGCHCIRCAPVRAFLGERSAREQSEPTE